MKKVRKDKNALGYYLGLITGKNDIILGNVMEKARFLLDRGGVLV